LVAVVKGLINSFDKKYNYYQNEFNSNNWSLPIVSHYQFSFPFFS